MPAMKQNLIVPLLLSVTAIPWLKASGQLPAVESKPASAAPVSIEMTKPAGNISPALPGLSQLLLDFKESDIKFSLQSLMNTLRDSKHEGWVLAAYPDPKTRHPLIGAGFGLDVPEREHPQTDPLNPHPFIEPSSAQLWQAAGLDPDLLQRILDRFDQNMKMWSKKKYRRKIRMRSLDPDITSEEATRLLRISSIQAIQNARAYCRNFDQLTGPQQMALSQLVFQMGVNLQEFVQFLGAINSDLPQPADNLDSTQDYWKGVQHTLIESDWARRYRTRAATVIAMFDPDYLNDPRAAELRVMPVQHRTRHRSRKSRSAAARRNSSTARLLSNTKTSG
jgi:hypothetical protein